MGLIGAGLGEFSTRFYLLLEQARDLVSTQADSFIALSLLLFKVSYISTLNSQSSER